MGGKGVNISILEEVFIPSPSCARKEFVRDNTHTFSRRKRWDLLEERRMKCIGMTYRERALSGHRLILLQQNRRVFLLHRYHYFEKRKNTVTIIRRQIRFVIKLERYYTHTHS